MALTSIRGTSTFRTTQMDDLLIVDDEPKTDLQQVSHVSGATEVPDPHWPEGSEAIGHSAKGQTMLSSWTVPAPT